jgi:hypothetical protein
MADFIAAVRARECAGVYFPGYLQAQRAGMKPTAA